MHSFILVNFSFTHIILTFTHNPTIVLCHSSENSTVAPLPRSPHVFCSTQIKQIQVSFNTRNFHSLTLLTHLSHVSYPHPRHAESWYVTATTSPSLPPTWAPPRPCDVLAGKNFGGCLLGQCLLCMFSCLLRHLTKDCRYSLSPHTATGFAL